MTDAPLFPELDLERARLAHSRACRDAMIAMFERVDPLDSADEFTKEYIEVTVEEALEDLRTPGAGDFFGRIDEDAHEAHGSGDVWYIGRRHIEDEHHDPVVIDWRAPIAAPFYRATVHDPLGLRHRRRFMMTTEPGRPGEITSYLDERLDDPDSSDAASGIPDPVLAEIGAARTGAMREIVATIQAEQDVVIRAPMQQALIVQGGPGTGKTAVGLHRAAYLLFEHRRVLARTGVLVVGPNQVFLDYIGNVLPSLGERSVQQRTVLDLCVPRVEIGGTDSVELARLKGDARMLEVLQRAVRNGLSRPTDPIRVPLGARTWVVEPELFASWMDAALADRGQRSVTGLPLNGRRAGFTTIAKEALRRHTESDEMWSKAGPLRDALVGAWPRQQPRAVLQRLLANPAALAAAADGVLSDDEQRLLLGNGAKPGSNKRPWTAADQILLDETNSLLDGPPFQFGHVVVDEAQDHSAVALRVIGRRCPGGSFTILGDLAQSTTPAGQQSWPVVAQYLGAAAHDVAHLTIGYRVPEPVLTVANQLLPHTAVDTVASRSVRAEGDPPTMRVVPANELAQAVAEEVLVARHRHVLTGVVAPARLHEPISEAIATHGLEAVSRVQDLERRQIPMFSPEAVKGLEFDAVVVVNPAEIFDGTPRGARLLYVAMTRAVQVLRMVGQEDFDADAL